MEAKVQLRGFDTEGNETVFETVYGNSKSYDICRLCEQIVDCFFQIPFRKNNSIKEFQVTLNFFVRDRETEVYLFSQMPFMVECQENGMFRIYFFGNQMFRGNINKAVIDTIDANFLESIVRTEIEKINITKL